MAIIKKLSLIIAMALCFACASCGSDTTAKTDCNTGWDIASYELKDTAAGTTSPEEQFVCLSVTRNGKKIKAVWLNVAKLSIDESKVVLNRYQTSNYEDYSNTTYKREAFVTRTALKNSDGGWIKITDDYEFPSDYLKISFYGGMEVRELVVISENGDMLSYTLKAAKLILKDASGKIYGKPYYTADEIKALELGDNSPEKLNDEQSKFSIK